jgi:hypothetical protein
MVKTKQHPNWIQRRRLTLTVWLLHLAYLAEPRQSDGRPFAEDGVTR